MLIPREARIQSVQVIRVTVWQDVLFIANDWQTGLLPIYHMYKYRQNDTYTNSKCIFVIHNINDQAGVCRGMEKLIILNHCVECGE